MSGVRSGVVIVSRGRSGGRSGADGRSGGASGGRMSTGAAASAGPLPPPLPAPPDPARPPIPPAPPPPRPPAAGASSASASWTRARVTGLGAHANEANNQRPAKVACRFECPRDESNGRMLSPIFGLSALTRRAHATPLELAVADGAVAAPVLGRVQRLIGPGDDVLLAPGLVGIDGHSQRQRGVEGPLGRLEAL